MGLTYTTIQHAYRKSNQLSMNEYTLCDMIYHLSTKPKSSAPGWCYMSKISMGLEIGVTKQAVLNMLDRLISSGFLEKNSETKFLKTTEKWQSVYFLNDGKETLPMVKKLYSGGKETLPLGGKESLPNNNSLYNNKIDNGGGASFFESLIGKSFEIFSEAGVTGVFFSKMKNLYSLSDVEVNNLFQVWKKENEAKDVNFKTKEHLRNSFNAFIKKTKEGGGNKSGFSQPTVTKAKGGKLI